MAYLTKFVWIPTRNVGVKMMDSYMCSRCLDPTAFEDMWTAAQTENGKLGGTGFMFCPTCRNQLDPATAWQQAHAKMPDHDHGEV